jgi:hypothetical protein
MKTALLRSLDFDRLFGIFCIALAGLFGYGIYTLEESSAFQQIGPKLWPAILSIGLVAIGAAILFEKKSDAEIEHDTADDLNESSGPAWVLFVAILLSAPILMFLGFWPAGSFLMAVVFFLKETRDHFVRSALCTVIVPGVVYYAFTRLFEQFLPTGSLFQ